MTEIILPPEENEETPQAPELNIDKPTENSKVITIEFEAKKTNKVSTKDTNQQLYTTDTDAWFEFKETTLENANGTYSVVFRNRHDGSIFQRTGDVVNGVAYYKIPHQEIRHAGAWRGQLVYTLENGNTTAREFGYDVKGHILDGKDVREIVVEDFETLMSQLNSMKDNAEQELANLVNTANQNETDRQAFFDSLVADINDLQTNYDELLDTGVLQTNINEKLEELEEEYAPRLTEVTTQLAHKADKGNVSVHDINKNLGKFDETWMTDEFKQQMAGDTPIHSVPADRSITNEKLAENSVDEDIISFLSGRSTDSVSFIKNVESPNITKGKNLFDGNYDAGNVAGNISHNDPDDPIINRYLKVDKEHSRTAIIPVNANTDYVISKEISNRFRVALSVKEPAHLTPLHFIRDDVEYQDSGTSFAFNSGNYNYLLITVSVDRNKIEEPFLQVELGNKQTEWETYGYTLFPEAKSLNEKVTESDYLRVEDYREGTEGDDEVIQKAFDNADGQVVSFESGREYLINETIVATAKKVRGIKGNNATLVLSNDITGLRYEGTLIGTANPGSSNNKELDLKESNAYIKRLKVTSLNGYEGNGIEITKLISANIENCHTFNLKNGIVIKGRNRNLIFENCHVRDNLENGLSFENVNLHQLNMTGMHIGYNKNGISIIDGEIANWQMSACDIESNSSSGYGNPESLINIETTEGGITNMWEVNFSALTIQDHGKNTKPLINIDVKQNELLNFVLGSSHVSNSSTTQPLIYIDGGKRIGINNVTMKNKLHLSESIVLGDNNESVIISSNHLPAPIRYGDLTKLIVSTNVTTGFVLEEVDDGNVLIINNI